MDFDWPMVVFFFSKESYATGTQTLRKPDSRSTCTAHRLRSHCCPKKPTLLEKSRKLGYWQDRNLSRENFSALSTSTDVDQVHRSAQPFLFPASFAISKLEQPFFFFFEMSLEESIKKDNKMNSSLIPLSVLYMVCLLGHGLDRLL